MAVAYTPAGQHPDSARIPPFDAERPAGLAGGPGKVFVYGPKATGLTGRMGRVVVKQARAYSAPGRWEPRRDAE